jgi:hypothetical protein
MALQDFYYDEDLPVDEEVEEGKPLGPAARKKSATVKPSKDYPTGRFPMPDAKHARLALQMLPKAKGLSSDQKAKIRARANKMLGKKK